MLAVIICVGILCYALFYLVALYYTDCDLELAFYEKFGKPIDHLKGKVVFITGASSGIGKHTALTLSKYGVKLVLAARRESILQEVKAQCIANSKGGLTTDDVLVLPIDLLDFGSHKRNFDLALSHFGKIDVLFNNAGRSQRAYWEEIDMSVDKEVFELNVFAIINLTRIAVKYFSTRGYGHVAVTSSLAGFTGVPFSGSYTGSKYAIHGYFNSLRTEKLGGNLDLAVSIICPGPTFTDFLQECFTGKPGEKYAISVKSSDCRMTGERSGQLCAIALANQARESWLGRFPALTITYFLFYFPALSHLFTKYIGPEKMFTTRDSTKNSVVKANHIH